VTSGSAQKLVPSTPPVLIPEPRSVPVRGEGEGEGGEGSFVTGAKLPFSLSGAKLLFETALGTLKLYEAVTAGQLEGALGITALGVENEKLGVGVGETSGSVFDLFSITLFVKVLTLIESFELILNVAIVGLGLTKSVTIVDFKVFKCSAFSSFLELLLLLGSSILLSSLESSSDELLLLLATPLD